MTRTLDKTVLLLLALVPLLVPFGLVRNVGLQAILVCLTGFLAWLSVCLKYRHHSAKITLVGILLTVYLLSCAVSFIANWSVNNGFGTTLIRLGSLEMIACVGIGLTLRKITPQTLATYLYTSLALLAVVSLPYTWLHFHSIGRLGGLFFQSDFMAVVSGVGFLLGIYLWRLYPAGRKWLMPLQAYLVAIILLTQTRSVPAILLIIVLSLIWVHRFSWQRKVALSCLSITVLVLGIVSVSPLNNRLHNASYAASSISYRLALQQVAVTHLADRPLQGYGAGSLSKPLSCQNLTDKALLKTCQDGYYFTSSHNVFLDRFLMLGWLGGTAFAAFIGLALYSLWLRRETRLFGAVVLLIVMYYLTNVASLEIELLLWVALCRATLVTKVTHR